MRSPAVVPLLALAVVAAIGCGSSSGGSGSTATTAPAGTGSHVIARDAANAARPVITMGSKNFTEELVLGQIYAQALKAAGYRVKTQLDLGSEQIALKALKARQIDAYPEYTGTILTSFCHVRDADVSHDPRQAYAQASRCMAAQGIDAISRSPFTDSNGFAVTAATAKRLGGITTLSQLKGKSQALRITGPPECAQRTDCLLGLEKTYGLHFKRFISIDLAKRHEVLTRGQTDVGEVLTSDAQIKTGHEVLLRDDKGLFPPYNVTLLARRAVAQAAGPDLAKTINMVAAGLTLPVMQELNARVDLDKQTPAAVAAEYLRESGYVRGS